MDEPLAFGQILRQYRLAAFLTQEALAEAANISTRAVSDLERGLKMPRLDTLELLANALNLPPDERVAFKTAGRRGADPAGPQWPEGDQPDAPPRSQPATAHPDLPSGTLTFLFTDVEGSTALWEHHPDATGRAIARHDALVDEVLARHGGRQVKERGEGDSIFAVFSSPSAALAAAVVLQRAVLAEPWPEGVPLRVRMGLHTGEAELRGIGYYGVTVNRTARIRNLGHGGQVLLSQATAEVVRDALPAGVELRPMGSFPLAGLARPEAIFQLVHPALPGDFPPLRAPQTVRTNLPAPLTSFVGRERDQAAVLELLGGARLVTLTGPGGAGKSRLAVAVARALIESLADGAWMVEMAPLTDPALVPGAVAAAVGVREQPGESLDESLRKGLESKHLLMVLDNCERLVEACADLAIRLLRDCPKLRVLVTSRERLDVPGEMTYLVAPLPVPGAHQALAPEHLAASPAVALFVDRARAANAGFALTEANSRAVAQICRRLDGLPLAIELAAARLSLLTPDQILARLEDRFRLLTGGRQRPPHQQTLRAALNWSHDLLDAHERALFRRLAVFAGGCTLEAVEAVCSGDGAPEDDLMGDLAGLVHKSLVVAEAVGEAGHVEARYLLLETVGAYSLERLEASGETEIVRRRHALHYLEMAETAETALRGARQATPLAALDDEHDNLRAALRWARDAGEVALGLRMVAALWRYWYVRGHLREGRGWLEGVLAAHDGAAPPSVRARALQGAASLAEAQGDYERAEAFAEAGLAIQRAAGASAGIAASLNSLGNVALQRGELPRAIALYEESAALWRSLGGLAGLASALNNQAMALRLHGDYETAATRSRESLRLRQELADKGGIAFSLDTLGSIARDRGEIAQAVALYEESLALWRDVGDRWGIATALTDLGIAHRLLGDPGRAAPLAEEGLAIWRELEESRGIARALLNLAALARLAGEPERARALGEESLALARRLSDGLGCARCLEETAALAGESQPVWAAYLLGGATALREAGTPRSPVEQRACDRLITALRTTLDEATFTNWWDRGHSESPEELVGQAFRPKG